MCGCLIQVDSYNVTHCAGADGYETLVTKVWPWVDASVYSFIPLVVIATLNSLIVRHVVSARRLRRQLASFRSSSPTPANNQRERTADSVCHWSLPEATSAVMGIGGQGQPVPRARSNVASRCEQGQDARMIALLLAVSFTFLAATLPRCATLIATEFIKRSLAAAANNADDQALYLARIYGSVQLALAATDLLMYANHAVNFFLYCATGQKFRLQLCALVFVIMRQPQRVTSSRMNVGGAVSESVGLRQRRVRRCDHVPNDDSVSQKSIERKAAV